MTVTPGTKFGPYEILALIGAGGMGEVYRARDPRVGRDVAVKVSSEQFSDRFTREIHAVAALNHPNIAALYDVGPNYLVMELVEGPTLADRIRQGAIPLEESLEIARQIADALEAAHEKGIVHRDLKPGNIKVRPDGTVKVLDFGLAKVGGTPAVSSEDSPTLSVAQTAAGVILGTAAYMAPEQARGKTVDKRADIWAFGVVLYEMLTGRQLFTGETVSDTLASVLKEAPEWGKVPANVRPLLRRCLEKDPKKRLRDIGDAAALLETAPESLPAKRPWLAWAIAGILTIALALSLWAPWRSAPSTAEPIRFQIAYPDKVYPSGIGGFALSPDGLHLAFTAKDADGVNRIWIRALHSLEVRYLPGTESRADSIPFWSPDSRYVVFDAGGKLKKADISGGPPQTLCDLSGQAIGGSWNRDDVIIFADVQGSRGIMRVPASGGTPSLVTKPNPDRGEVHHVLPAFLPDGRRFLYVCNSNKPETAGLYVGSLDAGPEDQRAKQLMATSSTAIYVPSVSSAQGHLLFQRERMLMTQPFDSKRLEAVGDPVPLTDQIGGYINYGFFSVSQNGILIYRSSRGQLSQPTWFDRQGKVIAAEEMRGGFAGLALSPDGKRAAISWDPSEQNQSLSPPVDIWLLDFAKGTNSRFTFAGEEWRINPIWSPDGTRLVFSSDPAGGVDNLYLKPASGSKNEELLLESKAHKTPTSWSADGRFLLYTAIDAKTRQDIWVLPMENGGKERPFLRTEFNERDGRFSPDMRWIAYVSDESGRNEVYVRGFSEASPEASTETAGRWLISKGGGEEPRWRGDGKELFYRASDRKMMAVEVTGGAMFEFGTPKELFQAPIGFSSMTANISLSTWDVTADGRRFFMPAAVAESSPSPFNVILNWTSLLRK